MRYLPTGDTIHAARFGLLLVLNQSQDNWLQDVFNGFLEYASHPIHWDEFGETTREEAAAYFSDLWNRITPMYWVIGMIADFPEALDPVTGWLPCDGALYYIADYPDLFDTIGVAYNQLGDPVLQFRVPDLRGRVRAGYDSGAGNLTPGWADLIGGSGGEESHTLSAGEMPSHTHIEGNATSSLINGGLEAPALAAVPSIGTTGSSGGDGAHNNVQPTMVFQPHIFATF